MQSLKDINANLCFKLEEMKNGVLLIKEEDLVKDLDEGFVFLNNMKIELNSLAEVKGRLKDINIKINEYGSIWRDEFEIMKNNNKLHTSSNSHK